MNLERQWCAHDTCADWGKVAAGNIKVHSYVEQRFYCTTCLHTFSADIGTFFETIRTKRAVVLAVLASLTERNSVRAVERLEHCPHNTILHWLDLAGQHLSAVSQELIRDVAVSQAQVDELWTFIKKSKRIYNRLICLNGATPGSGERSPYRVGYGSSAILVMNAVKLTPLRF